MIDRLPQWLRRTGFWLYAAVLFTLTHWPRLEVNIPGVERPDLFVHFLVFGAWCAALFFSGYLGPLLSYRTLPVVWGVSCLYAALDEGLQYPEFVHRHAAWDDLAADIGGVTLGALTVACWIVLRRRRRARSPGTPGGEWESV